MNQTTQVVWVKVVGYGRRTHAGVLVPVPVLPAVKRRVAARVLRSGPPEVLRGATDQGCHRQGTWF